MIHNYDDFMQALQAAGFSLGGANAGGIFTLLPWAWNEPPPYDTPVRWYTGDPALDPNEWIGRAMAARVAYGKLFFKKSGFITEAWLPYFLAVRRGGTSFDRRYERGEISHAAKRIYEVLRTHDKLVVEDVKQLANFTREEKSAFDRGLTELQMRLFISPCGRRYKVSKTGEEYGMASTIFCLTEHFCGEAAMAQAASIDPTEAAQKISAQVKVLNPQATDKNIGKFIFG